MALEEAVQRGRLGRNRVSLTQPPRKERARQKLGWTLEEARTFLGAVEDHRLYAAFHLCLVTGLRRGEVLALRWNDVDLEHQQLEVVRQLAIERGRPVMKRAQDRAQRASGHLRGRDRRGRVRGLGLAGIGARLHHGGTTASVVTDLGMAQPVGRTEGCWDNWLAESFCSSLNRELVHRHRFADRASARRAIFAWINRYNRLRLHCSLGYLPPIEWEDHYRQPQADLAS
jgi:integrase